MGECQCGCAPPPAPPAPPAPKIDLRDDKPHRIEFQIGATPADHRIVIDGVDVSKLVHGCTIEATTSEVTVVTLRMFYLGRRTTFKFEGSVVESGAELSEVNGFGESFVRHAYPVYPDLVDMP